MLHPQDLSHSDSDEDDYYSANEHEGSQAGSDIKKREEMMDWELAEMPASSVSIPCTLEDTGYTATVLLCANAAIVMAELQSAIHAKQLLSEDTLHRIVMLGSHTDEVDMNEVLDLPLFSSKFTSNTDTLPNTVGSLRKSILTLSEGDFILLTAGILCITLSTIGAPRRKGFNVIVFTPPSASSNLKEAALHRFPDVEEACTYIGEFFQPLQELNSYELRPKPASNSAYDAILPIYEGNLRLLARSMKLSDLGSDIHATQRRIMEATRTLAAEENKTKDAIASGEAFRRQIAEVERQLAQVQETTNRLLLEQSHQAVLERWQEWDQGFSPEPSTPENNRISKGLAALDKAFHATAQYLIPSSTNKPSNSRGLTFGSAGGSRDVDMDMDASLEEAFRLHAQYTMEDDAMYRPVAAPETKAPKPLPGPPSRPNSYNPPLQASRGSSRDHGVGLGWEEALRLQAQFTAEEEASRQLAKQLEEEERAQIAAYEELQRLEKENAPFDCPICADTHPHGNLVKVEACGQDCATCRECLLRHVKAQIEQARWPIFCPVCPSNSPNRGGTYAHTHELALDIDILPVVSRWMAEIVGADDAVFEQWNRMELAGFSISVECPKCKVSTPLDAEDFREATTLDCPRGCGCHWCKNCHREIDRKAAHSCDGEAEFREMVKQQADRFRPCPRCGSMIEKNGGCDHMKCTAPGCGIDFSWGNAGRR